MQLVKHLDGICPVEPVETREDERSDSASPAMPTAAMHEDNFPIPKQPHDAQCQLCSHCIGRDVPIDYGQSDTRRANVAPAAWVPLLQ